MIGLPEDYMRVPERTPRDREPGVNRMPRVSLPADDEHDANMARLLKEREDRQRRPWFEP